VHGSREEIYSVPPGIALGQALKAASVTGTGGEAKVLIQSGEVRLNGEIETRRGRKLQEGDVVEVGDALLEVR
jgi:ribosome-associated protein